MMTAEKRARVSFKTVALGVLPWMVLLAAVLSTRRGRVVGPEGRVAFSVLFMFGYYFVLGLRGSLRGLNVTYARPSDAFWGALRPAAVAGVWAVIMEYVLR